MDKQIELELASFPAVPQSLVAAGYPHAGPAIVVSTVDLCHHMYEDLHGVHPSVPNPMFAFHSDLLANDPYLRYVDGGLGTDTEAKRFFSWLVGRALCRWFLDRHLQLPYCTHISTIIGKKIPADGTSVTVVRQAPGDTPDYICSDGIKEICIGEAKGSQDVALSFVQAAVNWRQQFTRISVLDSNKNVCCLKGYISAARLVTSSDPGHLPRLWIEDPSTAGNRQLSPEDRRGLARVAAIGHYSSVMGLISLHELSNALLAGPHDLPGAIRVPSWRCVALGSDRRFVGFPWGAPRPLWFFPEWPLYEWQHGEPPVMFLSLGRARRMLQIARGAALTDNEFYRAELPAQLPDGLSMHSDGTIYGQAGIFEYEGMEDLAAR